MKHEKKELIRIQSFNLVLAKINTPHIDTYFERENIHNQSIFIITRYDSKPNLTKITSFAFHRNLSFSQIVALNIKRMKTIIRNSHLVLKLNEKKKKTDLIFPIIIIIIYQLKAKISYLDTTNVF